MNKEFPRILLAAPASGSGKTTIVCGILQAIIARGKKASAFKCGPDFIDPMFHREIIGASSCNLDTFFTEEEALRGLFTDTAAEADISVAEGVMGYYDGAEVGSMKASTYELAGILQFPVVLIINAKGAGTSILPIIKGFLEYREDSGIKGIILNQLSPALYPKMKECIETELKVAVLGYLPVLNEFVLQSRHLGLLTPNEIPAVKEKLQSFAQKLEQTVDIERLLALADSAVPLEVIQNKAKTDLPLRIGIAMDEAFCFYYQESLKLFRELGATLVPFSPLYDKYLPNGLQGLLIGGGYPERYAKKLQENESMRTNIRQSLNSGMPCVAECGGFLYLQEALEDEQGCICKMTGFFEGMGFRLKKRTRFGYIHVTLKEDSVLGKAGTLLPAHEFHYWDSSQPGKQAEAYKPDGIRHWDCMRIQKNVAAGFPHFYFCGSRNAALEFLRHCGEFDHRAIPEGN